MRSAREDADNGVVRGEALEAPYTAGTQPPEIALPEGATDCHHHIFDPRVPEQQGLHPLPPEYRSVPPDVDAYRRFKRRLGITRSVLVAPSNYGDDNSLLTQAIETIGADKARGVAIVKPDASDVELDGLHAAGVRGIRIYLGGGRAPAAGDMRAFAARAGTRGWHLQLVGDRTREVFVDLEPLLSELPCTLVIDHFGYAPQPAGHNSATAAVLHRLMAQGNTYVKLSGVYIQSKTGFPLYDDMDELARDLIAAAPDRLVWGTDWPHVGAGGNYPDGAKLVEQLDRWAPDADVRRRILVENPHRLYWTD